MRNILVMAFLTALTGLAIAQNSNSGSVGAMGVPTTTGHDVGTDINSNPGTATTDDSYDRNRTLPSDTDSALSSEPSSDAKSGTLTARRLKAKRQHRTTTTTSPDSSTSTLDRSSTGTTNDSTAPDSTQSY